MDTEVLEYEAPITRMPMEEKKSSVPCPCCGQGYMTQDRLGGPHRCNFCKVEICLSCGQ